VSALIAIDNPPASVLNALGGLGAALDATVPSKDAQHLLLGTWNIRAFGGLTPKWRTDAGDSPKRNLADLVAIAEIVSRFDVCAIQETRGDLTALRTLVRCLGPGWGFVVTDVGEGEAANDERLAYVFDRGSVRFSGLAGELVIAEEEFGKQATPLRKQFARTPYMVSFEAGPAGDPVGFTLISLHVVFGERAADRTPEIRTLANRLKLRAEDPDEFGRNLIALGDFNIDRWIDDPNADAFRSEGLTPPFELLGLPRTIFDNPAKPHFYDQIAWFTSGNRAVLTLGYQKEAGFVNWEPHLLTGLTDVAKSWRISDHFPLWARFEFQ
jgi:endonuclease/exonuclease/phosphatase family metal-dependent hydrolase